MLPNPAFNITADVNENHKIQELEEQIRHLSTENQRLKVERVVKVIQQKEVTPQGYEAAMKRLRFLEKEYKKLRKLLEYGNISTLETLILDYKAMSKIKLEKIVQEYQFYFTNHEERMLVRDFIDYLHYIEKELQKLLFLGEESGELKND